MSGDSSADVTEDEDFFDQPLNTQGAKKKAAAEQGSSPRADGAGYANASSYHGRSYRRSSKDDSNFDNSLDRKRASVEEYDRGASTSGTKCAVAILLPPETQQVEEQSDDSKSSEGVNTERKDSFQEQPPRYKKNKKFKVTGEDKAKASGLEHKNHGRKSSMSSYSKSDYSSDEEKRQLEARHSRRSASIASTNHSGRHLGTHKYSRAMSAPAKRPQQFRPLRGFGNESRMEVKALLESLLEIENPRPRRTYVANPVEYRRRMNYTFSDQRLQMIERENKRLLENLIKIHYSEPTYDWKSPAPVKPTTFPDVARTKQLEKIQKENLV